MSKQVSACCGYGFNITCVCSKCNSPCNLPDSDWIYCKDRLPENSRNVEVSYLILGKARVSVDHYLEGEQDWFGTQNVYAWRELPEPAPYKEEDAER